MANAADFQEMVRRFLHDEISVQELEDWCASASWNIHKSSPGLQQLAYQVQGALSEYSNSDIDYSQLRKELANAILPFRVVVRLTSTIDFRVLGAPPWMEAPTRSSVERRVLPKPTKAAAYYEIGATFVPEIKHSRVTA
jgi:hypothetical protein